MREDFTHRAIGRPNVEAIVKIRVFIVLALTLLAVSACVVEPIGGGYHGGGGGWSGHEGGRDAGRRVWR